ncbi:NUDIX hydrolase [Heliobacterium mobile]|uniref:NUDIX hydrolase n=1 Tax=Heliobacterium mobile TaxID=28064 RepID=UPI0012D80A29|nr:NUDIX hydrolase [Heliobacterium mobile]
MTIQRWSKGKSETVIRNQWINLTSNEFFNDGVKIAPYYLFHYPDWVVVVPVTKQGKIVLVRQYRPGIDQVDWELPSGAMDKRDDSPEAAAVRELREETGYAGVEAEFIASLTVHPSAFCNRCYIFLVQESEKVSEPQPDETEWIESAEFTWSQLEDMIMQSEFIMAPHIGALYQTRLKFPKIFV